MALDLGTVLAVAELVQKALEIYRRIDDLPDQMAQIGRRMKQLNNVLVVFHEFIQSQEQNAKRTTAGSGKQSLLSGQLNDLREVFDDIKFTAKKVHDLFDRYENGILSRSLDLEFRKPLFARVWFAVFDNPADRAEALIREIDGYCTNLNVYLNLLNLKKAYKPRSKRPKTAVVRKPSPAKGSGSRPAAVPAPAAAAALSAGPSLNVTPASPPVRRDYKILFVDPYNIGRSVVAQALVSLLGRLTKRARGDWRLDAVQSSGFFVRRYGGCVKTIENLTYSHPTFRKPLFPGGERPKAAAMAAVFDNKWMNYSFKKEIRDEMTARTSRGLSRDIFSYYDFITVFTLREHDNMVRLKAALRKEEQSSGLGSRPVSDSGTVWHGGKGRVIQLGMYLARKKGELREIWGPRDTTDPVKEREQWNQKVSEIKVALKEFLRQEMEWTPPTGVDIEGPKPGNPSLQGSKT
ncbi:hypothetical protein VTJ49DRAFT_5994 [Mycothermus thermophilus]|uniref:Uncharacterized protein n=1 Tax=Humicola insolens TaxID=85995 RepID=A0ABR3VJQ3_HUMIN